MSINGRLINTTIPSAGGSTCTLDTVDIFNDGTCTGLFQFNSALTDLAGNGDLLSGSSTYGDGRFGDSIYLNGTQTASRTLTAYGKLNLNTTYSVSFWFKATTISKRNILLYIDDTSLITAENSVELSTDNKVRWGGWDVSYAFITPFTLNANQWYHCVSTYDNATNTVTGYLDGKLIGSATCPNTAGSNASCFAHGGVGLTGYLEQARIFTKVLDQSEVSQLYGEGCVFASPSSHFNTVLYTADGTSNRQIPVGFQPDFVWIKPRNIAESNAVFDALRGDGIRLVTNSTDAEFNTGGPGYYNDGFVVSGTGYNDNIGTTREYVAWCLKAGGAASSNTDGTITSTVSANQDAGFSVVTWTSTPSTSTIGHGLLDAPKLIIMKSRTNPGDWQVYSLPTGATNKLLLNSTAGSTSSGVWGNTSPTDSVFTSAFNSVGDVVAYCFAEVDGFSSIGSYTGLAGDTSGYIHTGFEPKFVMYKRYDAGGDWYMIDNERGVGNILRAHSSAAEATIDQAEFYSNGFKITGSTATLNESSIFIAFADNPIEDKTIDAQLGYPVAHYRLDEDAVDYTGNGYNGTWSGTEAYATSNFGNAASFNGTNAYVSLGTSNQFQTDTLSVSVWVKYSTISSNPIISCYNGGSYAVGDFSMYYNDGTNELRLGIWDGTGYTYAASSVTMTAGNWYHIVYTKSNSVGSDKVYINNTLYSGSIIDGSSSGGTMLSGSDPLYLANHVAQVDYTHIDIDQVRIYDRALTTDEVAILYNETVY
jgi:hypothetical protein